MASGRRLPPRAVAAVAGIALGLTLLFSFRTADTETLTLTAVDDTTRPAATAEVDSATSPPTAGASSPPATGSTTAPATLAPAATETPAATDAPVATESQEIVVTGPIVSTRYGDAQVEIHVVDGTIIDIVALRLPDDSLHSSSISWNAEPILREEALAAQSAEIDTVSGATVTTRAYKASLQGALDALAG